MTEQEILSEINRCLTMEAESIARLWQTLEQEAVLAVAKALMNCKGKVILSGCGTSAMAARKNQK